MAENIREHSQEIANMLNSFRRKCQATVTPDQVCCSYLNSYGPGYDVVMSDTRDNLQKADADRVSMMILFAIASTASVASMATDQNSIPLSVVSVIAGTFSLLCNYWYRKDTDRERAKILAPSSAGKPAP